MLNGDCTHFLAATLVHQEFIQDVLEGYFPYELKDLYPDGVVLQVTDKRSVTPLDNDHNNRTSWMM